MNLTHCIKALLAASALLSTSLLAAETYVIETISDPQELAARGFDPAGPPIYRRSLPVDPRPLDARVAEREQLELKLRSPAEHGGFGVNWVSARGTDFQFLDERAIYTTFGNHTLSCNTGSPNRFADAPLFVANDRRLRFLDVWTRDVSETRNVDVALYQACQPLFTAGFPVVTELGMIEGSGSPGFAFDFISLPAVFPQNSVCSYWVRAMFSSCGVGDRVSVQKVRVIWDQ